MPTTLPVPVSDEPTPPTKTDPNGSVAPVPMLPASGSAGAGEATGADAARAMVSQVVSFDLDGQALLAAPARELADAYLKERAGEILKASQVITVDVEGKTHLAASVRELVDVYLKERAQKSLKNEVETWIDARWDKKRESNKLLWSFVNLASLLAALGLIWGGVRGIVSAEALKQVGPAVETEVKKKIDDVNTELAKLHKALDDAKTQLAARQVDADNALAEMNVIKDAAETQSQTAAKAAAVVIEAGRNVADTQKSIADTQAYLQKVLQNVAQDQSSRIRAATDAMTVLFKRYPRETGGTKEWLGLPLNTIILVPQSELEGVLNGHLEWIEPHGGKLFNAADAKWTKADGRPVVGSDYARSFRQSSSGHPVPGADFTENDPSDVRVPDVASLVERSALGAPPPVALVKINY